MAFWQKSLLGKLQNQYSELCRWRGMQDEAMDGRMDYNNIQKSEAA